MFYDHVLIRKGLKLQHKEKLRLQGLLREYVLFEYSTMKSVKSSAGFAAAQSFAKRQFGKERL